MHTLVSHPRSEPRPSSRHRVRAAGSAAVVAAMLSLAAVAARSAEASPPAPAAIAGNLTAVFQPDRTDRAALSPDGKYLAYSLRDGGTLSVLIVAVDAPQVARARVTVATDATSTPMMTDTREPTPAAIRWMEWVTPDRLVVETNASYARKWGDDWTSCAGAIFAFDADGKNARTLVTPLDTAERQADLAGAVTAMAATTERSTSLPAMDSPTTPTPAVDPLPSDHLVMRSPHVYDYVPGDPTSLLVLTDGAARPDGQASFGLYRVNIDTGKIRFVADELIDANRRPYFDRQGRLRLEVPDSTRVPFPHRFYYDPPGLFSRAEDLDRLAGTAEQPGFAVSPDNYFGRRAMPVGFDDGATVLYFASNAGRDTFGLYGLDLKTGRRTGLAVADPTYDLVEPGPDPLPEPGTLATDSRPDAMASTANNAETELPGPGGSADPASPAPPPSADGTTIPPAPLPAAVPLPDESAALVFDRFTRRLAGVRYQGRTETTRWLQPGWQAIQEKLEAALPGRSVEIEDWDRAGERFLVLAYGPADPGAFYVFEWRTSNLREFARRAPGLDAASPHPMMDFSFPNPAGGTIAGRVTFPAFFRIKPVPLVVFCPSEPWDRPSPDYRPDVQALADMGFAVAEYSARGAWGLGLGNREAIREGYEEAQVADLETLVDQLARRFVVDPHHVALWGEAHGGFVALRALQLAPQRFRCAVALNAPVDLQAWIEEARWTGGEAGPALVRSFLGDDAHLRAAPLARHPEKVTEPVFLLSYPGRPGDPRDLTYLDARRFAAAVRAAGTPVEWADLDEDFMRGLPQARAAVFSHAEEFLNTSLYDFKVKLGVPVRRPD